MPPRPDRGGDWRRVAARVAMSERVVVEAVLREVIAACDPASRARGFR
jgi:hypothetical protein